MRTHYRKAISSQACALAVLGLIAVFSGGAIADSDQASQTVKASQCKSDQTINQSLDHSIKSRALQDLGWYAFQENASYDVVRVVMVAKGTELRYRWRLSPDGSVVAINQAAANLCETGNRAG